MANNKIPLSLAFDPNTGNASGLSEFTLNLSDAGDVCIAAPSEDQVLTWEDGAWCPATPGSVAASNLSSLLDVCVSDAGSEMPENGQSLVWSGDCWAASTVVTGGGGGVSFPTGIAGDILYYHENGTSVTSIDPTITPLNLATTGYVQSELADYATTTALTTTTNTANAALPKDGGEMSGDITMAGTATVDGRDLSVDGAKLDSIEIIATNAARKDQANTFTEANSFGVTSTNIDTDGTVTVGNGSDPTTIDGTNGNVTVGNGSNLTTIAGANGTVTVGNGSNLTTIDGTNGNVDIGGSLKSTSIHENSLVITTGASAVSSLSGASGSIAYFEGTNPAPALQPITTILQNAAVRVEDKDLGDLANVIITNPQYGDTLKYRNGGKWEAVATTLFTNGDPEQLVTADASGNFTLSNVLTTPPGTTGKGDATVGSFIFFSGTDASSTEFVGTKWGAYWLEGPDQTTDEGDYFVYFSATATGDAGSTSGPAAVELASGVLDFIGTGYSAIDLSSLGDTNFTDLTQHQHIQWDGTQWINAFEDEQYLQIRNETGSTLTKGQLVYVSGAHNEDVALVSLAKADSATTMPSLGAVSENIANNADGLAVTFGKAKGLNTAAFNVGDTVYVSPTTAGEVTNTRPTGASELVQNVGIVTKSHASTGAIKVTGVGRANDVPNSATFTGSLNVSGAATFAGGATFNSTAPQSTVTPAASNDLTTKTYVDTVDAAIIAGSVLKAIPVTISAKHTATGGISFTTVAPSSTVTPATDNDLTNKSYVDSLVPKKTLAIGNSTASIANTEVDLTWATPEVADSDITISSGEITFAVGGVYSFDVSVRIQSNNRSEGIIRTYTDPGEGFTQQTNHIASNYTARDTDQDTGCVILSTMLTVAAGDKVKFSAESDADGTAVLMTAGTILKIVGWT